MTPEPLICFTEKWYDQIINQPMSSKIFDTLVRDFKLAITCCLSRTPSSKNFHFMNPQDRARILRRHPALTNQSLSTVTQSSPIDHQTLPPTFRKWNPVERARYLCHNLSLSKTKKLPQSTPRLTPRHPPGLSPIPSRPPMSRSTTHSLAPIITGIPTERTLKITVNLQWNHGIHETTAVIDSGATGSFIDTQLVHQLNLMTFPLSRPVKAYNIDGTTNCKGNITQETDINLSFIDYTDSPHSETI